MATDTYLVITDGTTTVTLADGAGGATNYPAEEWAPNIGGLNINPLASGGPFTDVVEEITLTIKGTTTPNCLLNIQTLKELLVQAGRWYRRDGNQGVVEIRYSPKGATVSTASEPLRAPIYEGSLILPPDFEMMAGTNKMVEGVRLRLVRRGWWTLTTTQNVTSTSRTNGDLHTLAFGAAVKFPSVTKLKVNGVGVGSTMPVGLIAVSENSNGIALFAAENGAPVGDYTSVLDSARQAQNSNVLRFTPTATTERLSLTITGVSVGFGVRRWAVFANVRNNSASTSFRVRIISTGEQGIHAETTTPVKLIPGGFESSQPIWTFVGMLARGDDLNGIYLAITASAASGSLDIDSIVLLDLTNPGHVIEVLKSGTAGDSDQANSVTADPKLAGAETRRPELRADIVTPTAAITLGYDGNPLLPTKATTIYARWLSTRGGIADRWRQVTAADALLAGTMVADRYISYISPE